VRLYLAATVQCLSVAPHSASSTRITGGAKQRRRYGETGGIATSIELIQRAGATPHRAEGSSVIGAVDFGGDVCADRCDHATSDERADQQMHNAA